MYIFQYFMVLCKWKNDLFVWYDYFDKFVFFFWNSNLNINLELAKNKINKYLFIL